MATTTVVNGDEQMFNPHKYMIRVKGNQQYLPVAARLIWFRQERPQWGIETQPLHLDVQEGVAVFQATIRDETGRVIAMATKMETRRDFADFVEKAETAAIGRALAMCGFGTQFAPELEEKTENGELRFADAPRQPMPQRTSGR